MPAGSPGDLDFNLYISTFLIKMHTFLQKVYIMKVSNGDAHITIRFSIARTCTQPELSSRRNYSLDSIFRTTHNTVGGRFPGTYIFLVTS